MTITTEPALDPVTIAIEQVASIVSACAAWQESVQRYSPDEAREFVVKSFYRVPEGQVTHPFAIVFELPGMAWSKRSDTTVLPSGQVFLHLGMPQESEDTELEERRFNNWHGQIIQDVIRPSEAGYVLTSTMTDPPRHTSPKDAGAQQPYWDVGYTINWDPFG